ncbi:MAG TPA: phosphoribosyltransferase family protein [Myxococcota bacterium]|nr:phosphoribosyltransferase family protein [Myxococcota bacterium]
MPPPDETRVRLRELHSARAVDERISVLAAELARALAGTEPLLVVIAEGARRFAQRLSERLTALGIAPELRFVRARRSNGLALRPVELEGADSAQFRGRDVVIADDIADEGRTLEAVSERVRAGEPRSLRTVVLVSKLSRRKVPVALDHVGFEVAGGWVVGYGMDLDQDYRELDWLGVVEGTEELE